MRVGSRKQEVRSGLLDERRQLNKSSVATNEVGHDRDDQLGLEQSESPKTKEASKLRLVVSHWSTVIRNVIMRPQGRRIQCDSKPNWPLRRAALAQDDTPRPPNFTSQNETQDYIQRHFSEWVTTSVAFCALCFCVILSRFEKFVIFLRQFCKITTKIMDFFGSENRKTDI